MVVDMSKVKKQPEPVVEEIEESKIDGFKLDLTREELDIIKAVLGSHKDFESFVSVQNGAKINKILLDLENL